MTKKRLDTPGMLSVEQGGIRITQIDQVIDQPMFKVWELTTKAKRVDIHHIYGETHEIWLSDYDYTMYSDGKDKGKTTKLYLDLNMNKHWTILVSGSKTDYSIVAYSRPNK